MCLIVFAWQVMPDMPLIAAANRDEFFDRPSAPAMQWDDHPEIYAGRDLQAGGTWLGISPSGRFAALTNVRSAADVRKDAPSDRKSTRLNSSHIQKSRMPSSA